MQLLLAEPDPALSREILASCGDLIEITACRDFPAARAQLVRAPPRILVTNLRLADYNGLHLVFLGRAARPSMRCIVHTDRPDVYLLQEAQAHGAFVEWSDRLPRALAAYVRGALPFRDRRTVERFDRRTVSRGGRRSADHRLALASESSPGM
jgi:DNA-binding NtrC family response regulator